MKLLPFYSFVFSAPMLIGCTYPSNPFLSPHERQSARVELSRWSTGQLVSYRGLDGTELRGRFYRAQGRMRAAVVALHGTQTHSIWYAPLAQEVVRRGVGLFAIDRRGSGLNAEIGGIGQMGPTETYRLWLQDISAAINLVAHYRIPVYLLGNSWGGNPVLAWTESIPPSTSFRGAILLTPGLVSRKPNLIQQLEIALSPRTALLGTCLSVKDYSERRSTWALLEEDPSMTRQVSARFFTQTKEMRKTALNHLDKVRCPLLVLLAGKDELMKNEATRRLLSRSASSENLKIVLFPEDYHLVLIENPKEVATQIATFVDSTAHGSGEILPERGVPSDE